MNEALEQTAAERSARLDVSDKFHFWLDEPVDWSLKLRHLRLSGWIVEKRGEPLVAIRATLRGKIFVGRFDRPRPEVGAHIAVANAPVLCGFTVDLRVPFGRGRLELQVARADGQWMKAFARDVVGPLRVSAAEERLVITRDQGDINAASPFFIARPTVEQWNRPRRNLHVEGWHFTRGAGQPSEVRARIRGKTFVAKPGLERADVAAWFEGDRAALNSGFSVHVNVPAGRSTLVLEARSGDTEWQPFLVRRVRGKFLRTPDPDEADAIGNSADWIRLYDTLSRADRAQIKAQIATFVWQPKISVVLPAYNTDARFLRRALDSVRGQLYANWELCVVDDGSDAPHVWRILQAYARRDSRIKIRRRNERGHISAASNDALALATGEFVALLDHDDELAPTALYFIARELNGERTLQLLYSDEDKLDRRGRRFDPHFKPDWNPDLFTAQNYISHLSVCATDLVRRVGGFRSGFEGAQDYDLTLRVIEQIEPAQIRHIPHVLYHWRSSYESTASGVAAKPYAQEAARRAMQEHFTRIGTVARVEPSANGYLRVRYPLPQELPRVSIIITTRDRVDLLRTCIESIRRQTTYSNFDILVVDNDSREEPTLAYLRSLQHEANVAVHRREGAFNFSALNNYGVAQASGAFVVLMNNDLEVTSGEWLTGMMRHALRPEVGAVGARLWYPNGTIQHAGVILGVAGIGSHSHAGLRRDEHGYFSRPHLTQNFSAVTAACLLVRRELYLELGGLDETNLPIAFNDVDFCLRLQDKGKRIVWTPDAELIHHESASRGLEDTREKRERFLREVEFMRQKWGARLQADPAYNPNLSLAKDSEFKLAFPPRIAKPWRQS